MTYLDHYNSYIAPKLEEIDLFIKTKEKELNINTISKLLNISKFEINNIIEQHNIEELNNLNFFIIMKNGSSEICELFKREIEKSKFTKYSISDICYIYNLPTNKVLEAKNKSKINEITTTNIQILFSNINI